MQFGQFSGSPLQLLSSYTPTTAAAYSHSQHYHRNQSSQSSIAIIIAIIITVIIAIISHSTPKQACLGHGGSLGRSGRGFDRCLQLVAQRRDPRLLRLQRRLRRCHRLTQHRSLFVGHPTCCRRRRLCLCCLCCLPLCQLLLERLCLPTGRLGVARVGLARLLVGRSDEREDEGRMTAEKECNSSNP